MRRLIPTGTPTTELYSALYILEKIAENLPNRIENVFQDLDVTTESRIKHAILILQSIEELGILYDPRFRHLSTQLRRMIVDESKPKPVEELRRQYSYSVFRQAPFWLEEELRQKFSVASERASSLPPTEDGPAVHVRLKAVNEWNTAAQQLQRYTQEVEELSTFHQVSMAAHSIASAKENNADVRKVKQKAAQSVRQGQIQRGILQADIRRTQTQIVRDFTQSFAGELTHLSSEPVDSELKTDQLVSSIATIMGSFSQDKKLSRKSRDWFQAFATNPTESDHDYMIQQQDYQGDPLFEWINLLNTPEGREQIQMLVQTQPREVYLLFKLMVARISEKTLLKSEEEFLLTQINENDDQQHQMTALVNELCAIAVRHQPTVDEIVKQSLPEMKQRLGELISDEKLLHLHREMFARNYRIKWGFRRTIQFKKEIVYWSTSVIAGVVGLSQFPRLLDALISPGDSVSGIPTETLGSRDDHPETRRAPDSLSREELARQNPIQYADVIQLPDSSPSIEGIVIGYIPFVILDANDHVFQNQQRSEFTEVEFITSQATVEAQPQQLVYRLTDNIFETIYPPEGFRISRVLQVDGERPFLTGSGEISWAGIPGEEARQRPTEIIIVADPLQPDIDPIGTGMSNPTIQFRDGVTRPAVSFYEGLSTPGYDLRINFDHVQAQIDLLKDSVLPEWDRELAALMQETLDTFKQTNLTDRNAVSQVVMQYSARYLEHIQRHRYYSLLLNESTGFTPGFPYPNLQMVAFLGDAGFYCTVAANTFQEFWQLFGVSVGGQPGATVKYFDNEAWMHFAHRNSRIFLPNGRIGFIDTTPPVTDRTPREDLEALQEKRPEVDLVEELKEEIEHLVEEYGTEALSLLMLFNSFNVFKGLYQETKLRRRARKLVQYGKETLQLNGNEFRILSAATGVLNALKFEDVDRYLDDSVAIIKRFEHIDLQEHGDMICTLADQQRIEDVTAKAPDYYVNSEMAIEKLLAIIQESWYSNAGGIRDATPLKYHAFFDDVTKGETPISIESIPSELEDVLHLAHLVSLNRVFQSMRSLSDFEKKTYDPIKEAFNRKELEERNLIIRQVTKLLARRIDRQKVNIKYLSFLERANMPFAPVKLATITTQEGTGRD